MNHVDGDAAWTVPARTFTGDRMVWFNIEAFGRSFVTSAKTNRPYIADKISNKPCLFP